GAAALRGQGAVTRAWRGEHVESLLGLSKEPVGVSVVTRPAESFGPARTLWPRSASTYPPIRPSISNGRKAQHEFHSHRYFELLVCPRGMWRLDFLGGSMEVAAGEVMVLTPFLTHGAAKAQTDPAGSPVWVAVDP